MVHMIHEALIEEVLERAVARTRNDASPPLLSDAIRYALFPGGARIRPRLCLAIADAGSDSDENAVLAASAPAAAIELLHCASLVHDDLPCFDAADQRRSKPSVHRAFGEQIALLAGDAMIVMVFDLVARECDRSILPEVIGILCAASGPPHGIIAGQAWESEAQINLSAYHKSKTGALFVAAAKLGALVAGVDQAAWARVGERLGESYQIADDIVDFTFHDASGPSETLGKPVGQDQGHARPNTVSSLGLDAALDHFYGLVQEAADAVPPCAGDEDLRRLVMSQATRLMPETLVRHELS